MYITYELLREKGACKYGLDWFRENFPEGCELNDETILKVKDCPTDFIWWFYNNIQQDKRLYKLCGVNRSNGVNWSDCVSGSGGVNWSGGVSGSFGILNSRGVCYAIFLADKPVEYSIFGKPVSEERYYEVWYNLREKLRDWRPTFNNIKALWLANGSDWKLTPIKNAKELSTKEAWEGMPKEAVKYVASLPEFDADMFYKITMIEVKGNA